MRPRTSPWGEVQNAYDLGRGAWRVTTASHGGIFLPPELDAQVPAAARRCAASWAAPGWYEEDCCAAIPLWLFPDLAEAEKIPRAEVRKWLAGLIAHGRQAWAYEPVLLAGSDELREAVA